MTIFLIAWLLVLTYLVVQVRVNQLRMLNSMSKGNYARSIINTIKKHVADHELRLHRRRND